MKTASDDLYLLIKSLDKKEKIYFKKKYATRTDKQNTRSLALFDSFDKARNFNESDIRKTLPGRITSHQFSNSKKKLYNLLLKSLSDYHSDDSLRLQVNREIHYTEILYKRGMKKQSLKQLQKSRKVAEENELFTELMQINYLENSLKIVWGESLSSEHCRNISSPEIRTCIAKYENLVQYYQLEWEFTLLMRDQGLLYSSTDLGKLNSFIHGDALLRDERKALSYRASWTFYSIHSIYASLIFDYSRKHECQKNLVELAEKYAHLSGSGKHNYQVALTNLIFCQIELGKTEDIKLSLKKLDTISAETPILKAMDFLARNLAALYNNNLLGNFNKSLPLVHEMDSKLPSYKPLMRTDESMIMQLQLFYACFGSGEFKLALKWINNILNCLHYSDLRKDIFYTALMMNIALHYELKDYDFLENAIRSAQRYFAKYASKNGMEFHLLKFLKSLLSLRNEDEYKIQFGILKNELEQSAPDVLKKIKLEQYRFLVAWLVSKNENISFGESWNNLKKNMISHYPASSL